MVDFRKKTVLIYFIFCLLFLTNLANAQESTETLTYGGLLAELFARHPAIRIADREIEAAGLDTLWSKALPSLEMSIGWSEFPENFNIFDADEFSLSCGWSMENPVKRRARIDVVRQNEMKNRLNLEAARRKLSIELQRIWIRIMNLGEIETNLTANLQIYQQIMEVTVKNWQMGRANYLDVLRMQTESARIGNDQIATHSKLIQCYGELSRLLGRTVTIDQKIAPVDPDQFIVQKAPPECMAFLKERSMILARARLGIATREKEFIAAKKGLLPDFSFNLAHLWLKSQPPFDRNQFQGVNFTGWALDFSASIPFPFGKSRRAEILAAQLRHSLEMDKMAALEKQLEQFIGQALTMANESRRQVEFFRETLLRNIGDQIQAALKNFQNGQLPFIELLMILNLDREIQREYRQAVFHYWQAQIDLEAAADFNLISGESNED